MNTASNRQEANRKTILVRRQTGNRQPPPTPAKPENWFNSKSESTDDAAIGLMSVAKQTNGSILFKVDISVTFVVEATR